MAISTHSEQKKAALTYSMTQAGIGQSYHFRTLVDFGNQELLRWGTDGGLVAVREGRGLTFVGTDKAYDAAILTARALHLQGLSSLVVPLRRLVKWLEHDTIEVDQAVTAHALFITGFHHEGDSPMLHWQRDNVEELLSDRIDNGRSVLPQGERGIARGGWWTETIVRRISRLNTEMAFKG